MTSSIKVRAARTSDVDAILAIRQPLEGSAVLLGHEKVSFYEAVPEFLVAEQKLRDARLNSQPLWKASFR